MRKSEKIIRWAAMGACELFTAFTIVWLAARGQYGRLPMAVITLALVTLPLAAERLLRCRMALPVWLFTMGYAVGPMLGYCYNLYYLIPWWDKLLHVCGGVAFALFGLFLFEKFADPSRGRRWMAAVFALCLSMAVAVGWEFFEYGMDTFFGMDMQDDVVVHHLTSYLLDGAPGKAGTLRDITAVTVNGTPLPVAGYIDIGLNDTMWDMLLETLGTLAVVVWYWWDNGRHRPFRENAES